MSGESEVASFLFTSCLSSMSVVTYMCPRALCRITLLLVTHVLVDTWMLTAKPVMDYKHTCDTIYTHFQGVLTISMVL